MSVWTADSATVTADANTFTADGGSILARGPGTFFGGQFAGSAHSYGQLNELQAAQFIANAPPVRSRSISWAQACRMAGRYPIEWYPVYHFGAGPVDRIFSEKV